MHREPYCRQLRMRTFNPMPASRRDLDEVSGFEHARRRFVLEAQLRFALQQQHPFGLRLLVPEPRRACLAVGHDALDSDSRARQQLDDLLLGGAQRNI